MELYLLQQASNNLAKSSVIACVALAGYNVTFKAEDKDAESEETEKPAALKPASKIPSAVDAIPVSTGNSYLSNASNIIQNNQSLIATVNNISNDLPSPGEEAGATEAVEKVTKSFSKYVVSGSPQNIVVKSILDILLTPFIANKLAGDTEHEVLKTLTQNTRNPYLIFDNSTRAQLLDFLEFNRQNSSKEQYSDITDIYDNTSKFVYDATRDELKIGGVYIRIYNEMPTFPIENPKLFVLDLLEYLKQAHVFVNGNIKKPQTKQSSPMKLGMMQKPLVPTPVKAAEKNIDNILNDYNRSKMKNQLEQTTNGVAKINYDFASDQKFTEHLIMTLNSLISVIKLNPNVELQCIGNFDILFGFLSTNMVEKVSF